MSEDNKGSIDSVYTLLLGAFIAFILVFMVGLWSQNELTITLRNAAIGSVFGALLGKFFIITLRYNVRSAKVYRKALLIEKELANKPSEKEPRK